MTHILETELSRIRRASPAQLYQPWDEVFEEYNIDPTGDAYREVYCNHDRDGNGDAPRGDKHDDDSNASSDDEHDDDSDASSDDDDSYPFGKITWGTSGEPGLDLELKNYVSPKARVKLDAYYRTRQEKVGQALMYILSMGWSRDLNPLVTMELRLMLRVANLNDDKQRGIIGREIARLVDCQTVEGIGIYDGEIYRIMPGDGLMVEPPRPRNESDLRGVTTTYAGMRKNSWSHIRHAQFEPFIFINIGILQIADIGILEGTNIGTIYEKYNSPSFKKMLDIDWLQTDYNVVMKINGNGTAGGIYIIWDFSPTVETKKYRRRLYRGNTEWGRFHIDDDPEYKHPRKIWGYCKEMRFSVAKIAENIWSLGPGLCIHPREIFTEQVDIHYTVKNPDGTIEIDTGPGYDPPEDYFLMFSETEPLQPSQ